MSPRPGGDRPRPPRRSGGSGSPGRSGGRSQPARAQPGRPQPARAQPGRPQPARAAGRSRARRRDVEPDAGGDQVEGRQAVRELLRAGRRRVRQVLVSESAAGLSDEGIMAEIVALARDAGVPLVSVPRARLVSLARTDAPQGVIATADPLPEAGLGALARRVGGRTPLLVVLDGVTDPHNLGAVMRSALCAGATGVVVGRHRSAQLTPTAVKAAAGAVEHLPVAVVAGVAGALSELAAAGVWCVGLDADAERSLWDLPVATEPVALVLGAEGNGLSRLVRQRCDVVVGVPLQGPLGALNVSAAATLACFEVARRRAGAPPGAAGPE